VKGQIPSRSIGLSRIESSFFLRRAPPAALSQFRKRSCWPEPASQQAPDVRVNSHVAVPFKKSRTRSLYRRCPWLFRPPSNLPLSILLLPSSRTASIQTACAPGPLVALGAHAPHARYHARVPHTLPGLLRPVVALRGGAPGRGDGPKLWHHRQRQAPRFAGKRTKKMGRGLRFHARCMPPGGCV
jgi:hypothetical protein